jgi:hypothetical protein
VWLAESVWLPKQPESSMDESYFGVVFPLLSQGRRGASHPPSHRELFFLVNLV